MQNLWRSRVLGAAAHLNAPSRRGARARPIASGLLPGLARNRVTKSVRTTRHALLVTFFDVNCYIPGSHGTNRKAGKPSDGFRTRRTVQMSHVEISPLSDSDRRRYVTLDSLPDLQVVDSDDDGWVDFDADEDFELNCYSPDGGWSGGLK